MEKVQIQQILEEKLRPLYEESRDSVIVYVISLYNEFMELREQIQRNELLCEDVYGKYNPNTWKYENGWKQTLSKEHQKMIVEDRKNACSIKRIYTDKFEKQLKNLIISLTEEIFKLNPLNIELGYSEHDFNFILDFGDIKRSFTINTIIASGYVQCKHYRTLKKLHKGQI